MAPSPEALLESARSNIQKHRYELALETLEKLKPVTADTRLGGEVQFLLAETRFLMGKYPEAEAEYGAYLDLYPDGPFSEDALYRSALSKIKQIEKISIGFFYVRTFIPNDRDILSLRQARFLLESYLREFPAGKWSREAGEKAGKLLTKEGEHELGIMIFYLRKDQPQAVIARAERVLEGDFPERIKSRARDLSEQAVKLEAGKGTR